MNAASASRESGPNDGTVGEDDTNETDHEETAECTFTEKMTECTNGRVYDFPPG